MTEHDWMTSTGPAVMLRWITDDTRVAGWRGIVTNRKLRLFACACCRTLPHLSQADLECLDKVEGSGCGLRYPDDDCLETGTHWACFAAMPEGAVRWANYSGTIAAQPAERAALLREIFGNPWRPMEVRRVVRNLSQMSTEALQSGATEEEITPSWLTPTVLRLAKAAFDERAVRECVCQEPSAARALKCAVCGDTGTITDGTLDPSRLAVLADALEEAGCSEESLLNHLRSREKCTEEHCPHDAKNRDEKGVFRGPYRWTPCCDNGWRPLRSPHYRGCWAVDLILGRQ